MVILTLLVLGLFSASDINARERSPEQNRRTAIEKNLHAVYEIFENMAQELNESHNLYHAARQQAQEREHELKSQLANLQQENEHMITIKAELALAQKDLEQALGNEAQLKERLAMVQRQTENNIANLRDEFESMRSKLEATTSDLNKAFW